MKILYITTIGNTMGFFKSFIGELIKDGHTVDIATNENGGKTPVPGYYSDLGCRIFNISCSRSAFDKGNIKAVKEIREIVEANGYDIVHCHTPIASVCTRIACRKFRKHGLKVFYTAHGFHFYKGAPLLNWLVYYPAELICSKWTDIIFTINHEDYKRSQEKLKARKNVYIPGIGIDVERFKTCDVSREEKRRELGIGADDYVLISVGELNANKNHQTVIRSIGLLNDPDIRYIIAGRGALEGQLRQTAAEAGVADQVILLGYRTDINELLHMSDCFMFPSKREGLGLAALEAMAAGLPIIAHSVGGIRDYCINDVSGYLCESNSPEEYAELIRKVKTAVFPEHMDILKKFDSETVNPIIMAEYLVD